MNIYALREVFVLLNDELRRMYARDVEDLKREGKLDAMRDIMRLMGLDKCMPGLDSWDSYVELSKEMGEAWELDYEGYLLEEFDALDAAFD